MAERIPQSVSYLVVFRAFLTSDGKTPATGKTIAITISKNGGAFGNPNVGALNATEISSGFYKFQLDTTDCNTIGPLAWRGAEATINDAGDVLTIIAAQTLSQFAAAVWQDAVAGDFTVAGSIGKSLFTSGNAPGAASGLALVGSNMGTVSSVTGSVGSVVGGVTVTTNNDKTGYTLTVTPPTAAQVATAVWQDATAGDFTVANSVGKSLYNAFTANTSVYTAAALANAPTGGGATAAQIATAVWQDATAGDFTVANSIGKALYINNVAPGGAGGHAIVGSNMGTCTSVTGAVGSVTGNVGGNVVGSVGSVVAAVVLPAIPANWITPAGIATNAIDADALAADAIAEIVAAMPTAPTVAQMWTTVLTESYRGTNAPGSAAQLLHEILQNITEFGIVGTTKTVRKFDGTTTAKTYTLNNATKPTDITEAA